MIYNVTKQVDLVESMQNFDNCPKGIHSHNAVFTIRIDSDLLESALIEKIMDTLTENTIYLQERWSLHHLAEVMKDELLNSGLVVNRVKLKLKDMEMIEAEV